MSWLATQDDSATAGGLERVLGLRPDLLERYRAFYGALWDEGVLPARLLELCRLRIAGLDPDERRRVGSRRTVSNLQAA